MFSRLRQDCVHQTVHGAAAWPLVCEKQRLPRKVFRSSIAWRSDWLSTLRSAGRPSTTQDSLPAAGQALPDGLSTRRAPPKGFRAASLHLVLLSQASWRNHFDRRGKTALLDLGRKLSMNRATGVTNSGVSTGQNARVIKRRTFRHASLLGQSALRRAVVSLWFCPRF